MSMILGAFQLMNPNGTVGVSWRHPDNTSLAYLTIPYWTELGTKLEDGGFDFLFFADTYGYPTTPDNEVIGRGLIDATNVPLADPIPVVAAVAAVTSTLGIVVTSSTVVEKPAALARRYGTLDHLTEGRIGWNIVTGGHEASALLMGDTQIPHDLRYEVAHDHVSICLKLWEGSWADDALVQDKAAGMYANPDRVRTVRHDGRHLSAEGLYAVPPGPQRSPLLVQAGTSGPGRELAAAYAEVVFLGGGDVEKIRGQIADIRALLMANGRGRDAVKFVVGAHFLLGADTAEATRKREEMLEFATLEHAATTFTWLTGLDLANYPLDEPLPDLHTEMGQSLLERLLNPGTGTRRTPREVLHEFRSEGHFGLIFVGDGVSVADQAEAFLDYVEADGFLVQPHITPGTYDDIIEHLMPELERRGRPAARQAGSTLRGRLFPESGDHLPKTHVGATYRFPA